MSEQQTIENEFSQQHHYNLEPFREEEPKKTHTKLGITAFILGLVSIIVFIIAIVVATSFIMNHIPSDGNSNSFRLQLEDEWNDTAAIMPILIAGVLMIGSCAVSITGLILGIIGICSRNKRKTFSILGIVLNALLPIGFIGLLILGLALGSGSV
ncbi:hypothetical protein [Paenibacillus sp. R14(2021)]|uniref:hypothetical protein n=1 Tax=Paenibacillus sp. R14(2021) TaxID=2859228 RepID=UPI001C615969|nr:hypothetical protein [Paenibacillus sp. R14(2021)]